ncbi:glycoside hydrolase family 3 N-terminal domain-containing protein [Paenibacillus sp. LHD-117]|uniref:glycoside hydrolase family 3 N-terminal domain-containing protein n=1 Tax=Paenibacillus sp. LHD-117 TaxID=3071412 RepID=UPI0027E107B6|nr:glycoside hydrolase family 3 N-terminal domain-containing protein [Paenibacillus sp. LHD-117]MDQ6419671.1 glycoside hydrolase family 3 N-terminal domain-containing protein [Paenibacillus sp. LHD-117]
MKQSKKYVSLLLSVIMLLGIVAPTSVFASGVYSIIYKANGGTDADFADYNGGSGYGSADPYTIKSNSETAFTYANHTFVKWNSAANGSGSDYNAGYSGTFAGDDNMVLYALWSLNAPTSVTAVTNNPTHIAVTWNAVPSVDAYKVERKVNGSADSTYETIANNYDGTSYNDATAVANVEYIYRVSGIDGSYAAQSIVTSSPAMLTPSPVLSGVTFVSRVSDTTASVKFTSNDSVSGTKYYYVVMPTADAAPVASAVKSGAVNAGGTQVAPGENTINVTGLTAGGKVVYIVVENIVGMSAVASIQIPPSVNPLLTVPTITGYSNGGLTTILGVTASVTATAAPSGSTQYFTLDGTNPTTSSTALPGNLRITVAPAANLPSPVQLKVVSYDGTSYSNVFTHTFVFKLPAPTDVKAGTFANNTYFPSAAVLSGTAGSTIYYTLTTDGTEPAIPTEASSVYSAAIPINSNQTTRIKAFAKATGATLPNVVKSDVVELTYKVDTSLKSLLALKTGSWTDSEKKQLIEQVISQLTLDEKINLIGGTKGSTADGTAIKNNGAAGGTYTTPRLMSMGIAPITLSDGPAGVRMGYKATTWTSPTAIASSWDEQLMHDIAIQTGKEAKFYGIDIMLSPGQNILRNPQSGRNFEYFSEDSYLSGVVAREYTEGVQSQNVGVTLKHYAGNEQETNRQGGNTIASERSLREVYLKGFDIAATAKPWSIMCSYNRLNGIYACENGWLLTDVLRGDFGFDGFVMSDWGATQSIVDTVRAQMDLTEPSLSAAKKAELKAAIEMNVLDVSYLNQTVTNLLNVVIKSNTFKGEYGAWGQQYDLVQKEQEFYSSNLFDESNSLARKTAADAMVLLKNNNNLLPLAEGSNVGLITSSNLKGRGGFGDNAITSSDFVSRGGGSAGVYFDPTHASVVSLEDALQEKFTVTNADNVKDIKQAAGYTKNLSYTSTSGRVTGINLTYTGTFDQATLDASAASLAASSNYGIYVVSRQTGEGADNALTGNDGYYLTTEEEKTLKAYSDAFHAQGKKLIVLLNIGAALDTTVIDQYADAILISWLPGQEGGHAITDVLSGLVNPSGKLTQTFTKHFEDSPSIAASKELPARQLNLANAGNAANAGITNGGWGTNPVYYDEGVLVGYKWFDTKFSTKAEYDAKVAYSFGYGLSYTKFEFSNLSLNKSVFNQNNPDDTVEATVTIKNVGSVKGKEVVQLYLGMQNHASEGRPMKDLRGYQKVELEPGASTTVTFTIKLSDLQYYDDGFEGTLTGTETTSDVVYGNGTGWTVTPGSKFNVIVSNTSNNFVIENEEGKQGVTATFEYGTPASSGNGSVTPPAIEQPTEPETTPEQPSASEILKEKFNDASLIPGWAREAVANLAEKGIIVGKADGSFDQAGEVTRAELLTMIVRAFGFKEQGEPTEFNDVPENAWFKSFIDIASSNGIANGIGNGQFGPKKDITRQDLSVMIYNALKAQNVQLPEVVSGTFTDDDDISGYAKEAVYVLKTLGVVQGRNDGDFDPKATASRAEAAVIIHRVLEYLQKPNNAEQTK